MKTRLLFINQFYAPDAAATAQMLDDLCRGFSAQGMDVEVICSRTAYSQDSAHAAGSDGGKGVRAHRVPALRFGRRSFTSRAASHLSFLIIAAFRGMFTKRPDVVVALTTPPLLGLVGVVLKHLRRCRLIVWSMDLYPEVAVAGGAIRPDGLVAKITHSLARYIYTHADHVVALGPFMKAKILEHGLPPDRVSVIPNWSDGESVRPIAHERNSFRTEKGLNGQFVVMYSGNMGMGHQFDTIVAAASRLSRRSDVRFMFVGDGPRKAEMSDLAKREGLHELLVLPYQQRGQLAFSLSSADVHLVSLRPEMQGLIVPSKVYGILAAGRPCILVGGYDNEVADIILQHQCGFVVHEGDVAGLVAAVLALASDPAQARAMGRRARDAFDGNFGFRLALRRWQRTLARTLSLG